MNVFILSDFLRYRTMKETKTYYIKLEWNATFPNPILLVRPRYNKS